MDNDNSNYSGGILPKLVKVFIWLAGASLLLTFILFYYQESTRLANFYGMGALHSRIQYSSDSTLVINRIDTTDFKATPYPDSGNTIIKVDDKLATRDNWQEIIHRKYKPGATAKLTFTNEADDTLETTVALNQITKTDFALIALISVIRFLISVAYIGVGIWLFMKRPNSGAVRALVLFCFSMGVFSIAAIGIGMEGAPADEPPFLDEILGVLGILAPFFGAFWMNLHLLFPKPHRLIKKYPILTYAVIYLPLSIALLIITLMDMLESTPQLMIIVMIQVFIGFYLLVDNYMKASNALEKRQLRLVMLGTGIALSGMLLLAGIGIIFPSVFQNLPGEAVIGIFSLVFLGILLSPLSIAYAIGKHRLLEVEGTLRRGTRYALTTVVLLAVFFIVIYNISGYILGAVGLSDRGSGIFVALVFAIGFVPTQRRFQQFLEKRIYPERYRLREIMSGFLRQSLSAPNKEAFWTGFEKRLRDALNVDLIYPVLNFETEEGLTHWQGTTTPFDINGEFIHHLSDYENRQVMVDEIIGAGKVSLKDDEENWLEEKHIAMILPLVTGDRFVGFIAIGDKSGGRDFEPADIELLRSLASQVAVASENMVLLEDNLKKRRLEDELIIARKIQQGLMPQTLPEVPGLEIAALNLFCLEVAGDYYDVIVLDENRTVLAIGDVSGKGAGAALIMSNLQASLRTAMGIDSALAGDADDEAETGAKGRRIANIVARVNELIYSNTPSDQFITFFVGIYNRVNHSFTYVNAGHNPPYLLRNSGNIEELTEGGIILGVAPGMPYEQGCVALETGDSVFLYTDGVTEAKAPNGEMYEEERLQNFLRDTAGRPLSDIMTALEDDVKEFTDHQPFDDDFTLLACRANSE
ncbi:MAG: SpoIIE family protein phosphatase [candidate division Zixibacteria bacterium]|nr:SpoIIE family protein phosphatase [candidate division Zixibacteria bacterium]